MKKQYLSFKRLLDILLSIIGIVFCLAFLWWWIFIINLFVTNGHPIFRQERYGKHKKVFNILKFRSMRVDANSYLAPSNITGEEYYNMETKFGRFLRKTSIDETLQLFNILFGQMSFVGPRPGAAKNEDDLVVEREKYTPNAFDVKPGLTGLAQVKMQRKHDIDLKAQYDHEYVVKMSILLDIKLFFQTIFKIFKRDSGAR